MQFLWTTDELGRPTGEEPEGVLLTRSEFLSVIGRWPWERKPINIGGWTLHRQRRDGTWRAVRQIGGKLHSCYLGRDLRDAEDLLQRRAEVILSQATVER